MKHMAMATIFLRALSVLSLVAVFTGCTADSREEVDTTLLCSAIFDAFMNETETDLITEECFVQLCKNGSFGAGYDSKRIDVSSVFVDEKYVCVCSVECCYDSYDVTNTFLYKISFSYDDELSKVTSAEVQNYATV